LDTIGSGVKLTTLGKMTEIIKEIKNNRAFVILFAVTLSALLLGIALGVANIALREVEFGTNARDTNDAYFAADVGYETALFNDKTPGNYTVPTTFPVFGLGSKGNSCASVTVDKSQVNPAGQSITVIISNGYNIADGACGPVRNSVVRQIKVTYRNI